MVIQIYKLEPYGMWIRSLFTIFCFLIPISLILDEQVPDYLRKTKLKLRGLSPGENYTDRATAACRPS
jgi:hypothetical protein